MPRSTDKAESAASGLVNLDALLAGDEKEFERLVIAESPRLFRVIVRMVRDEDIARGLVQETFLQAFKRLDTFRRESKLTTWLYAIGINLSRAWLRKNKRYAPLDEEAIERMQPSFSGGMYTDHYETWNPQRIAERTERDEIIRKAVAELPDDYRMVVTLRDLEELKTEDVAKTLGISNGAVRVRLHRARQALRKILVDRL